MSTGAHDLVGHQPEAPTPANGIAMVAMSVVLAIVLVLGLRPDGNEPTPVVVGPGGVSRLAVTGLTPTETAQASSRLIAPVTYQLAASLPALDSEAPAYRLRRHGRDAVVELRDALGLHGPVRQEEDAWVVDDEDLNLRVELTAGMPWALFQGVEQPLCSDSAGARSDEEEFAAPDCILPNDPNAPVTAAPSSPVSTVAATRPTDLPARTAAEAEARKVLERLGVDLPGARIEVTDGYTTWDVSVEPAVEGLPVSGMSWSLGIGGGGRVVRGNGWLADPVPAGRYPLVSPEDGFRRLADTAVLEPTTTSTTAVGAAAPVKVVQPVRGVRLGLLLESGAGGSEAHLVPVFLFSIGTGLEIPVVAVQAEFLTIRPSA